MRVGKPRILLVDDEPDIVLTVGKRLEVAGFEVMIAQDGEEAVTKAKEKPDIIILDLMLPKRSGLDVCATLRKDPECAAIPIILFTGKDDDDVLTRIGRDPQALRDWGADAYVKKTDGTMALLQQVQRLLGRVHDG